MSHDEAAALRARLAGLSGSALRDCLEQEAGTPAFRRLLLEQYPSLGTRALGGAGRRRFLSLLSASFALGGLAACNSTEPDQRSRIVPFVRQPTDMLPGVAMSYASAVLIDDIANGALITTRNGRPIKLEGNPDHPWSRGGTDIFGQASVLGLYDPDRSQSVRQLDRAADWPGFLAAMRGEMAALHATRGAGLRLLTPPVSSPSLAYQIATIQYALPEMRWHTHAPVGRAALYEGAKRAFGRPLETRWRFDRARVVVAIDGDFLDPGPQQVGASRDWVEARRKSAASGKLLELHAAASSPGLTSAKADYPATIPAAAIPALVAALEQIAGGGAVPEGAPARDWITRAGRALAAARGSGVVTIGAFQPPELHAAVHRLNAALGNLGQTVFCTAPALTMGSDLASLVADMQAGRVGALFMLDTNPVYTSAGAFGFAEALARVPLKLHAGLFVDETAIRADWHLPLKHALESWGDPRALDGTVTILQPGIRPLYDGRTVAEILSLLMDPEPRDGLALMQGAWRGSTPEQWRDWTLAGFIARTAFPEEPVTATPAAAAALPTAAPGLRVLVRPDPTIRDGAVANNGWLQELPKPLTKITWENVLAIGPGLAAQQKLVTGDVAELAVGKQRLRAPVWVLPGHADDAITITLGYGRQAGGSIAEGLGYDAYAMLPASGWEQEGASLHRTGDHQDLAVTQEPQETDGGNLIRVQTAGAAPVGDDTAFSQPSFYDFAPNDGRSWGMAIDIDSCIGCNACVTACQAENNIPVIGSDQVRDGRDMHWLRIDRYYAPATDSPRTHFLPVPCMHCENAPCELGCPVEATLHDHEGLNLQVYNRCIGTRACSSYCPYKVRHFNFLDYTANTPTSVQAQFNPDVTVRTRGVMEKCTYCVQRIVGARIESDRTNTPIPPNAVQTACAQACPTRAITFGDMARADSAVTAAKRDPRHYALLGELNTRPHTTYLAALAPAAEPG